MSEALALCFKEPLIIRHGGGHYVVASSTQKHEYQKFFKLQVLQKRYREQEEKQND